MVTRTNLSTTAGTVATAIAACRVLLGVTGVVTPRTAAHAIYRKGADDASRLALRMVAGRDLSIGLGHLLAARKGAPVRGWIEAGVLADLTDVVAFGVDQGRSTRPRARWGSIALASGATVAGLWAARRS